MKKKFNVSLLKIKYISIYFVMLLFIILNISLSGCNTIPEPSNLKAKVVSSTQINLEWKENSNDEVGFKIFRSETESNYKEIAQVNANIVTYSDTGLKANTTYYYRIKAFNDNGESDYSNVALVKTFMITWSKTFGGDKIDDVCSIGQTTDGGYIIAGYTGYIYSDENGNMNMWILKLDANGNKVWDRTFGGTYHDSAASIQQTTDGGYIVAGYTTPYGGNSSDMWILKLDANGNRVWDRTFGGAYQDSAASIQQTTDGGYIVAGAISPTNYMITDIWILKLDANGNKAWDRTHGGSSNYEYAASIQQTADGDYIVAGNISYAQANNSDMWILKLDAYGNKLWDKKFGGAGIDRAKSIELTTDGGYIVAGYYFGTGYDDGIWIVKLDANGTMVWDRKFEGHYYEGRSIRQTTDNGYIVAADSGYDEMWILKLDTNGNKLWDKKFGGNMEEGATSIQQTTDGGYIVGGYTTPYGSEYSDMWILKIDQNGELH